MADAPDTRMVREAYADVHCFDLDDPHRDGCPAEKDFDCWLNEIRAKVWDAALLAVMKGIPFWADGTGAHGFDLADGERGSRMAVTEILTANPYRKDAR